MKEVKPHKGDLVIMNIECQSHLWHKVLNVTPQLLVLLEQGPGMHCHSEN